MHPFNVFKHCTTLKAFPCPWCHKYISITRTGPSIKTQGHLLNVLKMQALNQICSHFHQGKLLECVDSIFMGKDWENRASKIIFKVHPPRMATTVEDVIAKAEMVEIEPKTGVALKPQLLKEEKVNGTEPKPMNGVKADEVGKNEGVPEEKAEARKEAANGGVPKDEGKKEEVAVEIEPKTGVSFPVKVEDGKQLNAVGLRKKAILGLGIKIYGFGIYADQEKLKDLLKSKIGKAPAKPTKDMYQVVIDSDLWMMVRLVIVYSGLTMSMVRKNFDEGLGASIKKLTGGRRNDELSNKVMGEASDDIKLTSGSVIEITRLPGYTLETKVMGEVVSKVESELLCRAYIHMYLGDDAFDKDAREKFGVSLLSLF